MSTTRMKRHEWWRHHYQQNRDLDHLSPEELSERIHDCLNNMRTLTERGKLGLLPINESQDETWMSLFTEVLEECNLRGYPYPGPISISKYRSSLDHAFDPIPNMERVLNEHGLQTKPYLLKFGESKWLHQSLKQGRFRIASASYYDSDDHNHARRDTEMQRFFRPNPKNDLYSPLTKAGTDAVSDHKGEWSSITSTTDYLLFCFASVYSSRLFGDFSADACLVIFNPKIFLNRLYYAVQQLLPKWHIEFVSITYYDPVRTNPNAIIVPKFKPFRHAYQNEMRLVCQPPKASNELQSINIEMGPLFDCATLVNLVTHPAPDLPHDPKDDPVQTYGSVNLEVSMVNQLPNAASVQGLLLNKSAPNHESWYFQVQYTDDSQTWHELKIPMLDGLYLLNLLRTAEKEQHLNLWNRT